MSATVISSAHNPRVKDWASLKQRKHRERTGRFLVEGVKLVEEALQAEWPLEAILWREGEEGYQDVGDLVERTGLPLFYLSPQAFEAVADTSTPQGIMAIAKTLAVKDESTAAEDDAPALWMVLDGLQDPGNVGTIIRTADAMGASGVITVDGTADVYQPKVVRATMGSLFHIPVHTMSFAEAANFLRSQLCTVYAAVLDGSMACDHADLAHPTAIVIGNESRGVSDQWMSTAHHGVAVPMHGHAESLNASIAASILLYEAARQRRATKS